MDVTTNRTAEDERKAREKEYGTYVATESISIDGALAFNEGDPVPVSHVEQYSLQRAVKKAGQDASTATDKATSPK